MEIGRDVTLRRTLPYTIYVIRGLLVRALSHAWGCFWEAISSTTALIMS